MIKRLALFIGGSVLCWVVLAVPARHLAESVPPVYTYSYSAVALGLCLVPTTLTLLWAGWAFHRSAEQQLLLVVGGTGLRMFVVLTAALLLYLRLDFFRAYSGFWVWILIFYLFTLALETTLLLASRSAPRGP